MARRLLSITLALAAVPVWAEVAGWRVSGGAYPDATPPLEWGGEARPSVRWKAQVGKSYSSPIVAGGRVFATAEPDLLVCLEASSGKVLWRAASGFADAGVAGKPVKSQAGNTAATPASDGTRVWAAFASGIVACYDQGGKRQWIRHFALPQELEFARSASPVLAGERLLVTLNHLFALDARTGRLLWRAEEVKETYGTPALARIGGVEAAITPGGYAVRLSDGKVLASGLAELKYATPLVRGDTVYIVGYNSKAVLLAPEAGGDKLAAKELWTAELEGDFFSSPVYHDGLLYTVNDAGVLYALEAATGKAVVEKELDIPNASGRPGILPAHIYPSIVLAGGHLFVFNDVGTSLVLSPGREPRVVGRNSLPEGAPGTPAFAGKRIFIRGGEHLYCIGE